MQHKRGDTFQYVAHLKSPVADGEFAGTVPTCQIRDLKGILIADVNASWIDPVTARSINLHVTTSTQAWKLGTAIFDVQFTRTSDGFVRSTNTGQFEIIDDVTKP